MINIYIKRLKNNLFFLNYQFNFIDMKNYKLIIILSVILFTASACGGGGSGTSSIQGKGSPERLE